MILPTNDIIKETLGEKHIIPLGWHILIQPFNHGDKFIKSDGETSSFERPDSAKERDLYQLGVGKILMMGDAVFKSQQFQNWTLFPEVGDYVAYPKYEGTQIKYNGIDCIDLKENMVIGLVPDPTLFGYYSFVGN